MISQEPNKITVTKSRLNLWTYLRTRKSKADPEYVVKSLYHLDENESNITQLCSKLASK